MKDMKVLVAYISDTGNTKKIAEAIFSQIDCEKEIKDLKKDKNIEGFDFYFLGFPTRNLGPDKMVEKFLKQNCKGKKKTKKN